MDNKFYIWNGSVLYQAAECELYQDMCDDALGEGTVTIAHSPANKVTAHLKYLFRFGFFAEHFKARMKRLFDKMSGTVDYIDLEVAVKNVADYDKCEEGYAEMAAWDLMYDLANENDIDIDSFAIGILPDNGDDYTDSDIPDYAYDPYCLAYEKKHYVFEKFSQSIMDEGKKFVVLVRVPWNRDRNKDYQTADYMYYRTLARRTFCGHSMDETQVKDIAPEYDGYESLEDVAERLTGMIVIDDDCEEGKMVCHTFSNPNREIYDSEGIYFLEELAKKGTKRGLYENFENDNY